MVEITPMFEREDFFIDKISELSEKGESVNDYIIKLIENRQEEYKDLQSHNLKFYMYDIKFLMNLLVKYGKPI